MQKVVFLVNFISVFFCAKFIAQTVELKHEVDSIAKLIKLDNADTIKLVHLYRLSDLCETTGDYQDGLKYANEALVIANGILAQSTKIRNPEVWRAAKYYQAKTYCLMGIIYDDLGDYPLALKQYNLSVKLRIEINDQEGIATSFCNSGLIYSNIGNYPEALKHYFIALKIFEEFKNQAGIAYVNNNIGNVYYAQSNYSEALKRNTTALNIRKKMDDKYGEAASYNNIGAIYFHQGNYDEALKNHQASFKLKKLIDDKVGLAYSYTNIGIILSAKGDYSEALTNYFSCVKIREETSDKAGLASVYTSIGNVLMKQHQYQAAEKYFMKAQKIALEIGHKEYLRDNYKELSELKYAETDYKKAYESYKLYISYRDSLVNEETKEQTIQQQMTFDFEKKEAVADAEHKKEIESQKTLAGEKTRKQNLVIVFVGIGLLLVLIFAGFIFRSLRVTRKQKHIIEQQKHLVEEHQKEIIDSITYAKRLQQAILPSNDEIRKHIPNHFILYQPKDIVAGDFYWMHVVGDLVFIAAADSTGHGVPGAMVSVVCSNALNRAVDEFKLRDTGNILDKTRELVLETFAKSGEEIKDGMDISLLCIDKTKKQIHWSGANNPLWYISSEAVADLVEIKANKQPIGKTDNPMPFTTHIVKYSEGDMFYLMTDGYPDQFGGPKGRKYKYKALEEKIIATSHLSLTQQHEELKSSFEAWKGNLEQVDDVTIIGIRI